MGGGRGKGRERREVGEKRAGSGSSNKAVIIYQALKYLHKHEPKMSFDLRLTHFETSGMAKK